ncbi:DUF7533 family protein [Halorhabdus rudnickae]|uniref:DUF7533 family protein n=1 Tax=Halorhabdus rudnickae TaxID=1775544 RepID=UPI0010830A29|nr:hypothetical protein [Halorhabdus rudnickae]
MASGILELIGQAGTVVVVAPILVLALDFLASGRVLGGLAFLGIIALILAVERYVVTPGDLLERGLGGAVSAVVKPPKDE